MLQFVQDWLGLIVLCTTFLYLLYVSSSWDKTHIQTHDLQQDMPSPSLPLSDQSSFLQPFVRSSESMSRIWGIKHQVLVISRNGMIRESYSGMPYQLLRLVGQCHMTGMSTLLLPAKSFERWDNGESCSVSWVLSHDDTLVALPTTIIRYLKPDIRRREVTHRRTRLLRVRVSSLE